MTRTTSRSILPFSPADGRVAGPVAVALVIVLFLSVVCSGPLSAQSSRDGRLVAIADIHGAYDEFATLLREIGLVDSQLRWIGGRSTLVQTGDVLDRGADVRKTMDLLMSLQNQAAAAGGVSAIIIDSGLDLTHLQLRAEGLFDKMKGFFGYDDIDFDMF